MLSVVMEKTISGGALCSVQYVNITSLDEGRCETQSTRAVAEMKREGKRRRGRPKLRWKDTARSDQNAWNIKQEWATDWETWKYLRNTRYPAPGDGGER